MNRSAIKGRCPSLSLPMPAGDGLLVRVKPPAGRLAPDALRALAGLARRHGNGAIDLTGRGNLQVRGLAPDGVAPFAEGVIAIGLADADPAFERVRNVQAAPLGPHDPAAAVDAHALAQALEAALCAAPDLRALPDKFGFLVDGGGALSLAGQRADVVLRAEAACLHVSVDGGSLAASCAPADATAAAVRLARAFLDLAPAEGPRGRMRDLVRRQGESALFATAGLRGAPMPAAPTAPAVQPVGPVRSGAVLVGFGCGVPFGRLDPAMLDGLAALCVVAGAPHVCLTPWRAVLIPLRDPAAAERTAAAAMALGLIVRPDDPRRRVVACVGRPACAEATVDARRDAARIAAAGLPPGALVHVSGCAKRCAHRGAADVTLVGARGRYDLVRGGDTAAPRGAEGIAAARAPRAVRAAL